MIYEFLRGKGEWDLDDDVTTTEAGCTAEDVTVGDGERA